jgi:RNase P subunit RPR2
MKPEELQQNWKEQGEEALAAVAQWRVAHPKATLAQIEQAVDEQMNRLRAQLIEQAAQASAAANSEVSQGLVCEQCGQALQARGRARRRWQTQGGQQVEVERTYVTCPQCGGGFFPPG